MAVDDIRTRVHRRRWSNARSSAVRALANEGRDMQAVEQLGWWEARENLEAVTRCIALEVGLPVAENPSHDDLFRLAYRIDAHLEQVAEPSSARALEVNPLSR